jgi:hypothetical protein
MTSSFVIAGFVIAGRHAAPAPAIHQAEIDPSMDARVEPAHDEVRDE